MKKRKEKKLTARFVTPKRAKNILSYPCGMSSLIIVCAYCVFICQKENKDFRERLASLGIRRSKALGIDRI